MKRQKITITVEKIGRKWIHVKENKDGKEYKSQLLLDDAVKAMNLKVGDNIEIEVNTEVTGGYEGHYKIFHYFYSEDKEIEKLWNAILDDFKQGYVSEPKVDRLHNLKCYKYDAEIENMRKEIKADRAFYYIKKNAAESHYLYKNGLQVLKELNCHKYDAEIEKIKEELEERENQKRQKYNETHITFFNEYREKSDAYLAYIEIGTIMQYEGKWVKIESRKNLIENASDYGCGHDNAYMYTARILNENDAEFKNFIAGKEKETVENTKKEIAKVKEEYENQESNLENIIIKNDELKIISKEPLLKKEEVIYPENLIMIYEYAEFYEAYMRRILIDIDNHKVYLINNVSRSDYIIENVKSNRRGLYAYCVPFNMIRDEILNFLKTHLKLKNLLLNVEKEEKKRKKIESEINSLTDNINFIEKNMLA